MITQHLEYLIPETIEEAFLAYHTNLSNNKNVFYYAGGSEIQTFSRKHKLKPDVLIDIKHLPELCKCSLENKVWTIGSCVNLNTLLKKVPHPCIQSSISGIADHTTRNHITLGGNLCGRLPYREAILPFLLDDHAKAIIYRNSNLEKTPLRTLFKNRLLLNPGDLLVGLELQETSSTLKWYGIRKTRAGKVDYPLVHVEAKLKNETSLSLATSGYFSFPTMHLELEVKKDSIDVTIQEIEKQLQGKVKDDFMGSALYRQHIFEAIIREILTHWEVSA